MVFEILFIPFIFIFQLFNLSKNFILFCFAIFNKTTSYDSFFSLNAGLVWKDQYIDKTYPYFDLIDFFVSSLITFPFVQKYNFNTKK